MTAYYITKLETGTTSSMLYLADASGHTQAIVKIPTSVNMTEALTELNTIYEINPMSRASKVEFDFEPGMTATFPSITLGITMDLDYYTVSTKNGDDGSMAIGQGLTYLHALADLARSNGFKSTYNEDDTFTLAQWVTDFNYGFERISADILRQEMEAIVAPDMGAW